MKTLQKNIPVSEPCLNGNEEKYLADCVQSGWVSSLGKYITTFEQNFADFCGVKHGVAVSNGTVALHLALAALGIGAGDEVITPTLSFIATANAVYYTNAKVVFADCEAETWNIDPAEIEKKITPHTKAIIPVHLYGHPANMDPILETAARHHLTVIEDAAEAHGAKYKGKRVGSLGKLGAFSFYGNKIITTGEGGIVVTDDDALAERMRFLRDHAMSAEKRYWHTEIGFNYRMTNLQAALGVAQMEQIDTFIARKRQIADRYSANLADLKNITLPPQADWAESVYWMYSILLNADFPLSRDEFLKQLKAAGVDNRPFFYPIHQMPPYVADTGRYPVADDLSRRGLNLPSAVTLTDAQVDSICEIIHSLAR
jgi:Predicted pyridoxal phosphate-dependent enzyme apparently involved in regulation of cell wall biogenesis